MTHDELLDRLYRAFYDHGVADPRIEWWDNPEAEGLPCAQLYPYGMIFQVESGAWIVTGFDLVYDENGRHGQTVVTSRVPFDDIGKAIGWSVAMYIQAEQEAEDNEDLT